MRLIAVIIVIQMLHISQEIARSINESFRNLFVEDGNGELRPPVCAVCDRFILRQKRDILPIHFLTHPRRIRLLRSEAWQRVDPSLRSCYKLSLHERMDEDDPLRDEAITSMIEQLVLSPRCTYIRSCRSRKKSGITCCASCKISMQTMQLPRLSIKNNNYFGATPARLETLEDYELAFLSPVKQYGYVFGYTGGKQRCLQGSLSYFKVKVSSIIRGVTQLDVLGLRKDVVIVIYGEVTLQQKNKIIKKCKLRVNEVMLAVEWLIAHNPEWQERSSGINMDSLRRELEQSKPKIVNGAKVVDGEPGNNVEETETFRVFFPDGTLGEEAGGQSSVHHFKQLLKEMKTVGYDMEFQCNFAKESVVDFKDNTLVNACLLQFPYGRGGMHEIRLKSDGEEEEDKDIDVDEYVEYLSDLSLPQFHRDRFVLILYNIVMRRSMMKKAMFRVRNNLTASQVATNLTQQDVETVLHQRRTGQPTQPGAATSFVNAVDAIASSVPHSNSATRVARRDGEAYCHNFGCPSWFLTIAPDDESSFFVLVHSFKFSEHEQMDPCNMTDEELAKYTELRHKIRIEFPGVCAYFFDRALDIVIEHIVGWNDDEAKPTDKGGIFGRPIAYIAAVEEQGRRTLHAHILVWIEGFAETQEGLHSPDPTIRRSHKRKMQDMVDDVVSTQLMSHKLCPRNCYMSYNGPFLHDCCVTGRPPKKPKIVTDQSIRNLRNRRSNLNHAGAFAYCGEANCAKVWTSTSFLQSFLKSGARVPNFQTYPDDSNRLKSIVLKYQQTPADTFTPAHLTDAAYNFHTHTKSCFCKSNGQRKRKRNNADVTNETDTGEECRYRIPKRKATKTTIQNAAEQPIKWYSWKGTYEHRHVLEVNVKRHEYDAFMNESIKAVSVSKIACNTNVKPVFPGPLAGYIFKYQLKDTQDDDTEAYDRVSTQMRKVLENRKHESNRSESMRRVLAASYAHQKTGVVGSPMASYLTRHKSRFRMSHKTIWCPLRDIFKLLIGGRVSTGLSVSKHDAYFVCASLHYLCRPSKMEGLTAHDFFTRYEVVKANKDNRDMLEYFIPDGPFKHPSLDARTGRFRQGVQPREGHFLAKIYERDFPDSAVFNGDILSPNTPITTEMEVYARQVLLLFSPFRTIHDLIKNGSFVERLREYASNGSLSHQARDFLQNLEDTASNVWRIKVMRDDLQRCTRLQARHEFETDLFPDADDDDVPDADCTLEYEQIEQLLRDLDAGTSSSSTDPSIGLVPDVIDPTAVKKLGTHNAGYECLSQVTIADTLSQDFITNTTATPHANGTATHGDDIPDAGANPTAKHVASLLIYKTSRKTRTFEQITKSKTPVSVLQANGSAASIIDWARKSRIDPYQRRAFEIFVATFVLTYHKVPTHSDLTHHESTRLRKETLRLSHLSDTSRRRRGSKKQLIALLHGPGGSGKSACIDLLMAYAREYVENFESDHKFTPQTIVVTALTGVAASILKGETVHSRLHLNRKKITHEMIEVWEQTRLVIIDEISFADKKTMKRIHSNLCKLRVKDADKPFGGLHIIFSGDFRQLEPVGKGDNSKPLYEDHCDIFEEKINCFLELKGKHRFEDDPEFGELLTRIRNGDIRKEDIDIINSRVFSDDQQLPDDLRYATYYNKDRDAINAALFEKRCALAYTTQNNSGNSILIFSDDIKIQTQKRVYSKLKNKRHFWNNCSESNIHPSKNRPRMDPVLRLYEGCPVMLSHNINVFTGQANGTRALFHKLVLKQGQSPKVTNYAGMNVASVTASQIEYVILQHERDDIEPREFQLKPEQFTFNADIPVPQGLRLSGDDRETVRMQAKQLPILVNNATTGHKLQGATIERIFVNAWRYEKNWPYVVLSRVKTLNGLFLRHPLTDNPLKFEVPRSLKLLLKKMKAHRPLYFNEDYYDALIDQQQPINDTRRQTNGFANNRS